MIEIMVKNNVEKSIDKRNAASHSKFNQIYLVKPVYNDHPWGLNIVAIVD